MLKNPFKAFTKGEWLLWSISLIITLLSNVAVGKTDIITLLATSVGVTMLMFVAKGDVWGQVLGVIFSILYGIISYRFRYYGEMITYLGMSMPISALSVISWLKNPYSKEKNEVRIHRMTKAQTALMLISSVPVTAVFYFILKYLGTENLFFSTISITTSYLAAYLMLMRNSWYAIAYTANDIVLIILWITATMQDIIYFPMIICFIIFLVNDLYGFISWKIREKRQNLR